MNTKYECPKCKHQKVFVRYIDTQTGGYLSKDVGKCDREDKCGYHYKPRQYFSGTTIYSNPLPSKYPAITKRGQYPQSEAPTFISDELLRDSCKGYEYNCLCQFLKGLTDSRTCCDLIRQYRIGTSKHWTGATIFWQIDILGKIRTGKIMLYNPNTGKRVKQPYNHITWVHSVLKPDPFNLQQCFFGEHLLALDLLKPVALVESEKTALIASIHFTRFIWLATGGKNGCKWTDPEVFRVLIGRKVVLWPDINTYELWLKKAWILREQGVNVTVSNLLETKCTAEEREQGLDIGDYLIKYSIQDPDNILVTEI